MDRTAKIDRTTKETAIEAEFKIDGSGKADISTGIGFFDHMLTLLTVHGFFDLTLRARGDLEVDFHHTVEDVGIVMGQLLAQALGTREGICRYGSGSVPMDEAFSRVNVDLSNRPYLVYNLPSTIRSKGPFDAYLAKEFFRAFSVHGGLNLHVNVDYGENEHHILESVFKALGRALNAACMHHAGLGGVLSSKGTL
ncbi:MAG: imidazoleglycerol-phosphate dehydratase HisB [Desulfobacterium sp.]|jgi:imidazoleglycerol-phosphate dehydratase|nr:imidazoleglycerol-phosphate dehydratase HisB [Desulfobacterium sp.]